MLLHYISWRARFLVEVLSVFFVKVFENGFFLKTINLFDFYVFFTGKIGT